MSERFQFRADVDLLDAIEQVAEEEGISKSEAARSLITEGLANLGGDLQHVADRQQLEQIKDEEHTRQRRAWFRHNVGSQLLKCWNGGLTPDEAQDATHGYRREAIEMHEDEDLLEYLQRGLQVYQAAYPDNGAKLSTWLKSRAPNADADLSIDNRGAVAEGATDAEPDADHPDLTIEEAAREYVELGWDPDAIDEYNARNVAGYAEQIREKMRELYDEQEGDRDE